MIGCHLESCDGTVSRGQLLRTQKESALVAIGRVGALDVMGANLVATTWGGFYDTFGSDPEPGDPLGPNIFQWNGSAWSSLGPEVDPEKLVGRCH